MSFYRHIDKKDISLSHLKRFAHIPSITKHTEAKLIPSTSTASKMNHTVDPKNIQFQQHCLTQIHKHLVGLALQRSTMTSTTTEKAFMTVTASTTQQARTEERPNSFLCFNAPHLPPNILREIE
jgi:hypothetical protein